MYSRISGDKLYATVGSKYYTIDQLSHKTDNQINNYDHQVSQFVAYLFML